MDRAEYKTKLDEVRDLIRRGKKDEAFAVLGNMNWRKVHNVNALLQASEIYENEGRYEDAGELLEIAHERSPIGRMIIYRLANVCIELEYYDEAREYYDEFVDIAPHDSLRYVIQYKLNKAKGADDATLISILEELKEQDFIEEWAYELAVLYHRTNQGEKCVALCDEIILWFGEGPYVERAMELKLIYTPLSEQQQDKYRQFQLMKDGITEIMPGDESAGTGDVVTKAMQIPEISVNPSQFSTINLQEEIKKNIEEIMQATETGEVSENVDTMRSLVESVPYAQIEKEPTKELEKISAQSRDIDDTLKNHFHEYLEEERDGQVSMLYPYSDYDLPQYDTQIEGQMTIEDVLANWEITSRAAKAALDEAEQTRLENAKEAALQEATEIVDRLAQVEKRVEKAEEALRKGNTFSIPKVAGGGIGFEVPRMTAEEVREAKEAQEQERPVDSNGMSAKNLTPPTAPKTWKPKDMEQLPEPDHHVQPAVQPAPEAIQSAVKDLEKEKQNKLETLPPQQPMTNQATMRMPLPEEIAEAQHAQVMGQSAQQELMRQQTQVMPQQPQSNQQSMSQPQPAQIQPAGQQQQLSQQPPMIQQPQAAGQDQMQYGQQASQPQSMPQQSQIQIQPADQQQQFGQQPSMVQPQSQVAGQDQSQYGQQASQPQSVPQQSQIQPAGYQPQSGQESDWQLITPRQSSQQYTPEDQHRASQSKNAPAQNLNDTIHPKGLWIREEEKTPVMLQQTQIIPQIPEPPQQAPFPTGVSPGVGAIQRAQEASREREMLLNQETMVRPTKYEESVRSYLRATPEELEQISTYYNRVQNREVDSKANESTVPRNVTQLPPEQKAKTEASAVKAISQVNEMLQQEIEKLSADMRSSEEQAKRIGEELKTVSLSEEIAKIMNRRPEPSEAPELTNMIKKDPDLPKISTADLPPKEEIEKEIARRYANGRAAEPIRIPRGMEKIGEDSSEENAKDISGLNQAGEGENHSEEITASELSKEKNESTPSSKETTEKKEEVKEKSEDSDISGEKAAESVKDSQKTSENKKDSEKKTEDDSTSEIAESGPSEGTDSSGEDQKDKAEKTESELAESGEDGDQTSGADTDQRSEMSKSLHEKEDAKKDEDKSESDEIKQILPDEPPQINLTPEERTAFAYFADIGGVEGDLCRILPNVRARLSETNSSRERNVIIAGADGCGKTTLASALIKVLKNETGRPRGPVGRINADNLNTKDLKKLFEKIQTGSLIIEHAGGLTNQTIRELSALMETDRSGILFILEDNSVGIEKILSVNKRFTAKFSERITIPIMTIDELANFGRSYASDLGYKIDELGVLALYDCINEISSGAYLTSLTDVKEIIDDAIDKAERGGIRGLLGRLGGRRYDEDGNLILQERDFD